MKLLLFRQMLWRLEALDLERARPRGCTCCGTCRNRYHILGKLQSVTHVVCLGMMGALLTMLWPCRLAEGNRLMPGSDGQCSASGTILRLFLAVQLLAYPYPASTVIGLNTMSLESLQYMQPPLLMSVCKHAAPRVTAKRLSLPAVLAPF